jgi:hypothetical protein
MDSQKYVGAASIIRRLKGLVRTGRVTAQQARTLRGQALAGYVEAAEAGLEKLVRRGGMSDGEGKSGEGLSRPGEAH